MTNELEGIRKETAME